MTGRVDLYDSTYGHFVDPILDAIRKETFGVDIGQTSWLTVDEFERFIPWLELAPGHHVLEVAGGSGGPALFLAKSAGCRVTGIDVSVDGVAVATHQALVSPHSAVRVCFALADATRALPFRDESFDAVLCIDAMNHFPDRMAVLREWRRVLRPRGRALFTDPVVVTGPVTGEELASRSSIGLFVFVPPGINERLVEEAGLRLVRQEDVTGNAALVAGRWHDARRGHRDELLRLEGEERFEGLQEFFATVHRLSYEGRLSRFVYVAEKSD